MNNQPRPTDFKGITFRSKTEAIFAKSLDLSAVAWEYEPERFKHASGWVPDFWICANGRSGNIVSMVLELKPCRPTQTYLVELRQRMTDVVGQYDYAVIAFVNPFDNMSERGVMILQEDGTWSDSKSSAWLFRNIEHAKRHRFDLA